jgi:serine/threonine protein kinase
MPVVPLPIQLNVHSMKEQSEHPLADLLVEEEREWSDREQDSISESPSLPGFDVTSQVSQISPGMIEAYHLSMLFSLANGFSEDSIGSAEPALANNLRNLRDLDIGAFNEVTEFIARGATFSVLRTKFPNSRNVVLKTRVFDSEMDPRKSLLQKLEAILLEVRVLTHPPLRRHNNIAQLIQIAWQGDSEDLSLKWPALITDYADKGTLQDLFENEAGLDFTTRLALFKDVTEGLHALHGCKIVHGDLKLMNILVYSNPQGGLTAKLSDFGGALMDNPEGFREPIGTPPWTAPEYGIERPRDQLFLSDVYALGLLFWRIVLHGKDPFLDPLFDLPTDSKKADEMKSKMKQSDDFIDQVQHSLEIQCRFSSPEKYLVGAILGSTIRVLPTNRSLQRVISLLDDHFEG